MGISRRRVTAGGYRAGAASLRLAGLRFGKLVVINSLDLSDDRVRADAYLNAPPLPTEKRKAPEAVAASRNGASN